MRIGLLSDTHVPYRASEINPAVFELFQDVDLILHAGDVDEAWSLAPLLNLAPLHAVRGNMHFQDGSSGGVSLPEVVQIEVLGFRIVLFHGHRLGTLTLFWKVYVALNNILKRWDLPEYDAAIARVLLRRFPYADIIVFGHTHRFYQARWGKTLLVNPGAALSTVYFDAPYFPSVAILTLELGQLPQVTRIRLG